MNTYTSPRKSTQANKAPSSSTDKATIKPSPSQAPPIPALNAEQPSSKMVVDSELNINPGESWYRPKPKVQTPSKDSWYRSKPELEMPTKYSWLKDGEKITITRRQAKDASEIPEAERNLQAGEYKPTVPVKHEHKEKREERGLAKLWAKIKE